MATHDLESDHFAAEFREAEARLVLGLTRTAVRKTTEESIQPPESSDAPSHVIVRPSSATVPRE